MQRSGAKTGPFPGDPNPGGAGTSDHKVLVDNADVVPEYLASKIISSDSSLGISTVDLGGGQRVVDLTVAATPPAGVASVTEGAGIAVDNTDPANPIVAIDPAYSARVAPRTFAFSNIAANYLPILQIPIAEYTKFGLGFDIIIRWSGTSSTTVLRYVNGQRVGNSGSAIFELVSGYCPPQLWASGQNLTILERTNGATKEWYLQAQLAYLDLTATVEVVNGWTADGITPTWATSAFVAGAPAGDNPTHLNASWKQVRTSAADSEPRFLSDKVKAGAGIAVAEVTDAGILKMQFSTQTPGLGLTGGEGLLSSLAIASSNVAMGGSGTPQRGWLFSPLTSFTATQMRIFCRVAQGNIRLGIFNSAGNLLTQSALTAPSCGIMTLNLLASQAINVGTMYYMALLCTDTNFQMAAHADIAPPTTSPLLQISELNPGAGTSFNNTMSSALSTVAWVPWIQMV